MVRSSSRGSWSPTVLICFVSQTNRTNGGGQAILRALSLAKQRAESRAARTYSITATGDTLFPLVHVPSGRPDPAVVAHLGEQTRHKARFFTVALFGLIPSVLVLVTLSWAVMRRRDAGR